MRTVITGREPPLARAWAVRYSPGRTFSGVAGMIAILTIVIFLAVIAGLNVFEFGRID